jgi:DUF4097 and DUF4098 domain-containing protein YvlB
MRNFRHRTLALAAFAALATVAATADARGSFSRTLNVTGIPDVDVYTGSGNITVRPGNGGTVTVNAKIRANNNWFGGGSLSPEERVQRIEANPPIRQSGNMITIGKIDDRELRRNVSIDYEVIVPAQTKLLTETGSGDADISGVNGPLRASTGSGNIRAGQVSGDARLSTGSGDVRLEGVSGRVYANTGSGNVVAHNVGGGIIAETGSGDIECEQTKAGDISARTGSGNIRLRGIKGGVDAHTGSGDVSIEGDATAAWDIDTGSGNINLYVPTSNFDVRAHSSSGSVTIDRPITTQGKMRRNRVEGKVGSGGVLVSLSTGSGDINLR